MFNFIKEKLQKIYTAVTSKMQSLFSATSVDEKTLGELESILISADVGVKTTRVIIERLREQHAQGKIAQGQDLKQALEQQLIFLLQEKTAPVSADVFLLVGINGSGKTTFASKLANHLKNQGKRVLLVAADTFRAAAVEQLEQWGKKLNIDVVKGQPNAEPASVIFAGAQTFLDGNYDAVIFDTAGRLQTKINLMKELEKIKKVLTKQLPNKKICTLLTVDAMLGQNSFAQAQLFNESTQLDGLVLTKLDGTGKGGIVFAIAQELHIPVAFISYGESVEQLKLFDDKEYVKELLS